MIKILLQENTFWKEYETETQLGYYKTLTGRHV